MIAAVLIATLASALISGALMWGGHYAYRHEQPPASPIRNYIYGTAGILLPATIANVILGLLVHQGELPLGQGFFYASGVYLATALVAGLTVISCYRYDEYKDNIARAREARNLNYAFTDHDQAD